MTELRIALFVAVSLALLYFSRLSLRRPRSHGFYRFLAWEAILALILWNAPGWWQEWLAWHQIISWILLCVSVIPLALGVSRLRASGGVDSTKRPERELVAFERTTRLVSDGIFHYIRHPLYSSLLLLAWGVFFKDPTILPGIMVAAATGLLFLTARRDEAECIQVFGADYQRYMGRTKMFIPFVV